MLNPRLYAELVKRFGEENVSVRREGEEAVVEIPPESMSAYSLKASKKKWVNISDYGEQYVINCQCGCGDTRQRLTISHAVGMPCIPKPRKSIHYGSLYAAHCYNENCDTYPFIKELVEACQEDLPDEELKKILTPLRSENYVRFTGTEVDMPKCMSLLDSAVPESVHEWIAYRGFSPSQLENEFNVKYIPANTKYIKNKKGEEAEFFKDRLLIPIINGRIVVGWQARALDPKEKKYKYINSAGAMHNYLYNFDKAIMGDDIVIVEGVSDVWRVGTNAIGLFGKVASKAQILRMKTVWSFNGRAVVCVDPDAEKEAVKLIRKLREEEVFSNGVAGLFLKDKDPAEHSKQEITGLIKDAFMKCTNLPGGVNAEGYSFMQF